MPLLIITFSTSLSQLTTHESAYLTGVVCLSSKAVPSKALSPIHVTLSGIVILVRLVQPLKALSPMLVTPLGIVMLVRLEQP